MVMELIVAQDTATLVIPALKKLWVTTLPAITPATLTLTAMVTTDTEAMVATDTDMATGVDSLGQFQFGDMVQLDAQTVGVIVQSSQVSA